MSNVVLSIFISLTGVLEVPVSISLLLKFAWITLFLLRID